MTHSDKAPTAEQVMIRRIMNDNAEYMNGVDRGQVRFGHAAVERMIEAAIRETREADAKTAEMLRWKWKGEIASAIRSGEYLENSHD